MLFLAVLVSISVLLFSIIRLKIPAFIALLLASIVAAIMAGMPPDKVVLAIKNGMGNTLGFIATVVGLGAIFGGILEHTGAAQTLARGILSKTGEQKAPLALMLTGFLVSIPVFFDVGIVILFPIIVALQKSTGKSMIYYAIPMFAGLAVTHAFVPPTPGPLAVADSLGVDLGILVLVGIVTGLPAAIIAGLFYGPYLSNRLFVSAKTQIASEETTINEKKAGFNEVLLILLFPIFLIIFSTIIDSGLITITNAKLLSFLKLLFHPFAALIIANFLAWYLLGVKYGINADKLAKISTKSLEPIGIIILVTGAGGVFKEVLVETGAGAQLAKSMTDLGFGIMVFAFLSATIIRVLQGSATVAMITAAGLVSPLIMGVEYSQVALAAIAIAIASGATMLSHLNDSGFWLIKEYLGITEKEGFRVWTVTSSIIGLTGFVGALLVFYIFG